MHRTAFLFPGYGSQRRGAGVHLFDKVAQFRSWEPDIDALLGYSVRALCNDDPDNLLADFRYAQPALYVLNALYYYDAIDREDAPDALAGHSCGEFNALFAADVFDLLTGLALVKKRCELIAELPPGGVAAVIGLDPLQVTEIVRGTALDIASYNSPAQTMVAGPLDEIRRADSMFKAAGAHIYLPLAGQVAFHSRYLKPAAESFAAFLQTLDFSPPSQTVMSSVTAAPFPEDSVAEVRNLLVRHLFEPVDWLGTLRWLMGRGFSVFREIGPGDALTRLSRQFFH